MNALEYLKRELAKILNARLVTMNLMPNTNDYDLKILLAILLRKNKEKDKFYQGHYPQTRYINYNCSVIM
jgi:hypothetical protein